MGKMGSEEEGRPNSKKKFTKLVRLMCIFGDITVLYPQCVEKTDISVTVLKELISQWPWKRNCPKFGQGTYFMQLLRLNAFWGIFNLDAGLLLNSLRTQRS